MKYVQLLSIMLLVTIFLIGNLSYGQEKKSKITVLTNGHLIDGTGKPLIKNVTVVIEGNIIKEIKKGTYHQPPGELKMQAIIAATRNCAEMCGVLDELGTVVPGKIADLIVVKENPLENISNLRKLKMILKDGIPVNLAKDEGQTNFWDLYFK